MWRVVGGVIVALVTAKACGGRIVGEVTVTGCTTDRCMCSIQWPYTAVVKCGGYPGSLVVTHCTIGREPGSFVIWIGGGVIVILVTSHTGIRCIVVVAVVTGCTVVGNGCVRSDQLVEVVVYRECGRCPSRIGSVAGFTSRWQVKRRVIRVDTLVVVGSMASCTGVGGTAVVTLVTVVAGYACVCTGKRPEAVV